MQSIVVIEDDRVVGEMILNELQQQDYAARHFRDAESGLAFIRKSPPHLVMTDLNLPGISGYEVCKAIRRDESLRHIPILILSARGDETDCVLGLESGADDYVIKPFRRYELIARIRVLLRRVDVQKPKAPRAQAGPFSLDPASYTVRRKDQVIPMSTTEFRLLYFLVTHPGRIFSRDNLLDEVWGQDRTVTPRNVDNFMYNLRMKIEPKPESPRYLKTIRGVGYVFSLE